MTGTGMNCQKGNTVAVGYLIPRGLRIGVLCGAEEEFLKRDLHEASLLHLHASYCHFASSCEGESCHQAQLCYEVYVCLEPELTARHTMVADTLNTIDEVIN